MRRDAGDMRVSARSIARWAFALALAGIVAACGGGSGSDLSGNTPTFPGSGSGSGDSGSGSGGTTSPGTVTLTIVDQATGQAQNAISFTSLSVAKAVVLDSGGQPVPNTVVRFSASDAAAIAFTPAPTALTGADGVASVTIAPASLSTAGAYTVTASAQAPTQTAAGSVNIAIGATQVSLGALSVGQTPLSAYGTTVVSAPVSGVPATTPVAVRFTSICATQSPAKASITSLVTTANGVARATYADLGCVGSDLVTATIEGTSVTQTATVQLLAAAISNLQFVSATPSTIVLKGTGGVGLSEVSLVRFRLVDQSNRPVTTPTSVTLSLSTNTGGLLIDNVAGPVVKQTNASGEVEVQVQSGTLPTPVWVIASLTAGGQTLTTNSTLLTVSTGRPTQNRFSLSVEKFNIEGWQYDGETTAVNILAADTVGNPVPDGTTINFISEGAAFDAASCTTAAGACTLNFRSQQNRPANGRVTFVAYSIGEETYDDVNLNNRYDAGEPFYELGYLYVDDNENARVDSLERVIPFNAQSSACTNAGFATLDVPSQPGTCDGRWGAAHVRRAAVVTLSGSFANFKETPFGPLGGPSNIPTSYRLGVACSVAIPFWIQDVNGNPMPYDTKITAEVVGGSGLSTLVPADVVKSTNAVGGTFHQVLVSGRLDAGSVCNGSGTVFIKATTPKGNQTIFSATVAP